MLHELFELAFYNETIYLQKISYSEYTPLTDSGKIDAIDNEKFNLKY